MPHITREMSYEPILSRGWIVEPIRCTYPVKVFEARIFDFQDTDSDVIPSHNQIREASKREHEMADKASLSMQMDKSLLSTSW
jgi:hypothetical protein